MPKSLVSGVEIVAMLNANPGNVKRKDEAKREGGFYVILQRPGKTGNRNAGGTAAGW
jgi:hypothetical protein